MSEEKQLKTQFDNDPERTLITLEQLSQTIEVMTSVVNRLHQHLSEMLIREKIRWKPSNQVHPRINRKLFLNKKKSEKASLLKFANRRMIQFGKTLRHCTNCAASAVAGPCISIIFGMPLSLRAQRHFFVL